MGIETQIVNGTITQTIITTDPMSSFYLPLALIAVTSTIAIITFVYNRKAYHETKISNELLKTEILAKLRPFLVLINEKINDVKNNKTSFSADLKNYGTSPARNIRYHFYFSNNPLTLESIVQKEHEIKIKQNEKKITGVILKNSSESIDIELDYNYNNGGKIWIVFWLQYDFLNEESIEEIIIVEKLENKRFEFYFCDHEQIKRSRTTSSAKISSSWVDSRNQVYEN